MANRRVLGRAMTAAAILLVLSLQTASANDAAYFKDVLKPAGHVRSTAAKFADGRACGVSGDTITVLMPAFQKCMSGRGWALDHYGPDPSSPRPLANIVNFTDVKGDAAQKPRGTAALQSDTQACDAGAKDPESAAFKNCMAGRGWQFAFTQRAPAPKAVPVPSAWAWSNGGSGSSPSSTVDDVARINADIDQGSEDSAAAMNAGIQATTAADAASDAQWQLNSELANAPVAGN
jgi:hypothetical protein